MAHDVFVSYASADKPTADAVCATLEAKGVRCWIAPRDITPGVDWSAAIVDAIEAGRLMVLVFSSNANASPQISREVERAVSKGLPIIPFRIEDVLPGRNLEYFLGTPHWLDAMTPPLESHLLYLAETVQFLLERGERPAPVPTPIPTTRRALPFAPVHLALGGGAVTIAVVLAIALGLFGGGGGAVEGALVGAWQIESGLSNAGDGSTTEWSVALLPDGSYTAKMAFKEDGAFAYDPSLRHAELKPAGGPTGFFRFPSWEVSGDTLMANTGALMPANMLNFIVQSGALQGAALSQFLAANEPWQREGAAPSGVAAAWDGAWTRELQGPTNSWRMKIDVRPDGRYSFEATIDDAGKIFAKDGTFRQVSDTAGLLEGDYQIVDKDTIIFKNSAVVSNPLVAQVTWKRLDR